MTIETNSSKNYMCGFLHTYRVKYCLVIYYFSSESFINYYSNHMSSTPSRYNTHLLESTILVLQYWILNTSFIFMIPNLANITMHLRKFCCLPKNRLIRR